MNYIVYVCSVLSSEYFFILLKKKSGYYTIYVSINCFSRKRCYSKKLSKRLLLGRSIPLSNLIKERIKESEVNSNYICDLVFKEYKLNEFRPKFIYSYEL